MPGFFFLGWGKMCAASIDGHTQARNSGSWQSSSKFNDSTQIIQALATHIVHIVRSSVHQWRTYMTEQQSDDFYIPTFLIRLPPKADSHGRETENVEDFLKNVEGWSECVPPGENDEWI